VCASGFAQVGAKPVRQCQAQFNPHLRKAAPDRLRFFIFFFPYGNFTAN